MPPELIRPDDLDPNGNSFLTLMNMQKIHDLRILARSIEEKLSASEKDPNASRKDIFREGVMLKTTQKEIRRLERKSLANEFMIE